MNTTVVGLGYVGLPLAITACKAGYKVFGLDNNINRVAKLNLGESIIEDLNGEEIKNCIELKKFVPTVSPKVIANSEIVLICVPTPLNNSRQPDLSSLIDAATTVGKNMNFGTLVIVESTIEPGTCRNIILPILMKESGLKMEEFELAYSPERIDPTNKEWGISNTTKLVSGLTEVASKKALNFYSKFIDSIFICTSLEIAETSKLLENSFRFVNISFINELAIYCRKANIDLSEVISAAATKPYGFMPFYPSVGVGGHCIPVDPIYLANAAKAFEAPSRFIELAAKVNQEIPKYFARLAEEKINGLLNKNILVVGVAYKKNVSDVRESSALALITALREKGANVLWHDDLVREWGEEKSVPLSNEYDLAILATFHDYLDLTKLSDVPILDTRGSI